MKRAYSITLEFAVYGLAAPVAAWVFSGGIVSFVTWQNAFDDGDSALTLRLFILLGVIVASFRTYHLIKSNKI